MYIIYIIKLILELLRICHIVKFTAHFVYSPLDSYLYIYWILEFKYILLLLSSNMSNMCEKSVIDLIPHTQHRPIWVSVNPVIVAQPTTFKRRFNLKKADWEEFSADLDSNIEEVDVITENYERFV